MTIKGLSTQEQQIIESILKGYIDKYEFFYYGSRVKGNFRKLSDLDILIKSSNGISLDDIETLKILFDESNLHFVVNFTDYNNINTDFYNQIKKDLIKVI